MDMYVLETFAKKRTLSLITFVDRLHVALLKLSHEHGEMIVYLKLEHEVKVIRHQTVGYDVYGEQVVVFFEQAEKM